MTRRVIGVLLTTLESIQILKLKQWHSQMGLIPSLLLYLSARTRVVKYEWEATCLNVVKAHTGTVGMVSHHR